MLGSGVREECKSGVCGIVGSGESNTDHVRLIRLDFGQRGLAVQHLGLESEQK